MIRITYQDKVLEIEKQAILSILAGICKNIYDSAWRAREDYKLGLINANGSREVHNLWSTDNSEQVLVDAMKDDELQKYFIDLKSLTSELERSDKKSINWLAAHFHIASLETPENRKKLNRKLSMARHKAVNRGDAVLEWTSQPAYLMLDMQFHEITTDIGEVVSKILERITFLEAKNEL